MEGEEEGSEAGIAGGVFFLGYYGWELRIGIYHDIMDGHYEYIPGNYELEYTFDILSRTAIFED